MTSIGVQVMATTTSDHNVTETALDAVKCKLSAVKLKYFDDPFLQYFVAKPTRRIPLIHRGYYLRHIAITQCVDLFLTRYSERSRVNILSLGAGFDTLFFRLMQQQHSNIAFVEIDCAPIVAAKKDILDNLDTFAKLLPHGKVGASQTNGYSRVPFQCQVEQLQSEYSLVTCDLGDVPALDAALNAIGIDKTLPTLILAECVVSYLDPSKGTALLRWISESFVNATASIYDPLASSDPFGATQQRYFSAKGCELRSLRDFQGADNHFHRFLVLANWKTCRILDMNMIYAGCTDKREKQRLNTLEPFDEFADWMLCNAHYALFIVTNQEKSLSSQHWTSQSYLGQQIGSPMEALTTPVRSNVAGSSTPIIIRTFQRQDLKAVQDLFESSHLKYKSKAVKKFVANRLRAGGDMAQVQHAFMRSSGSKRRSCFWVAVLDGNIVGCIGLKPTHAQDRSDGEDRSAELCRLSVGRKYRRCGIASALVSTLEEFAIACGYRRISLETIAAMETAIKFYHALGYEETSTEKYPSFALVRFQKILAHIVDCTHDKMSELLEEVPQENVYCLHAGSSPKGTTSELVEQRFSRCQIQTQGTELDLANLGLCEFPVEAFTLFPSLRKLNLRRNELEYLPEHLSKYFPQMASLNVSENQLVELPADIGDMKHLQKLNLEKNKIICLPVSFSQLDALEEVNLQSNQLKSLDEDIGSNLMKLKVLLLANNQLDVIPRSFGSLSHLRVVDLSGNGEVTSIPEKVRRLHERNEILHSRTKRRDLISRALRVRSMVAQNLKVADSIKIKGST